MRRSPHDRDTTRHYFEYHDNAVPPAYDKTIEVLGNAINRASIDRSEKVSAFKRLARLTPVDTAG